MTTTKKDFEVDGLTTSGPITFPDGSTQSTAASGTSAGTHGGDQLYWNGVSWNPDIGAQYYMYSASDDAGFDAGLTAEGIPKFPGIHYFNDTDKKVRVWDGSAWGDATPSSGGGGGGVFFTEEGASFEYFKRVHDFTSGGSPSYPTERTDSSPLVIGDKLQMIYTDGSGTIYGAQDLNWNGTAWVSPTQSVEAPIQSIMQQYVVGIRNSSDENMPMGSPQLTSLGTGAIYYAVDLGKYRVRNSTGWADLGGTDRSAYPMDKTYVKVYDPGKPYYNLNEIITESETVFVSAQGKPITVLMDGASAIVDSTYNLVFSLPMIWNLINTNIAFDPAELARLGTAYPNFQNAVDTPTLYSFNVRDDLLLRFVGFDLGTVGGLSVNFAAATASNLKGGLIFENCVIRGFSPNNAAEFPMVFKNCYIYGNLDLSGSASKKIRIESCIGSGYLKVPANSTMEFQVEDSTFNGGIIEAGTSPWNFRNCRFSTAPQANNDGRSDILHRPTGTTVAVTVNNTDYYTDTTTTAVTVAGPWGSGPRRIASSKVFFQNGASVPTLTKSGGGALRWEGGVAPVLTPNGNDLIEFYYLQTIDANNSDIYGKMIAKDLR